MINYLLDTYYVPGAICKHTRCIMSLDPQTILLVSIITNTLTMRKRRLTSLCNLPKVTQIVNSATGT